MAERLVLCGGVNRTGGDSILHLALDGRSQNITLKLEDISKRLVKNVPGRLGVRQPHDGRQIEGLGGTGKEEVLCHGGVPRYENTVPDTISLSRGKYRI